MAIKEPIFPDEKGISHTPISHYTNGMNDDDHALFLHVMADTKKIPKSGQHVSGRSNAPLMINLRRDMDDTLRNAEKPMPVHKSARQVDQKKKKKIKQGKMDVEGVVDLHGLTADQARKTLRHFIGAALDDGKRCVLVVTGKGEVGKGADDGTPAKGVIRRSLPIWLSEKPLDYMVLRHDNAKPEHGGLGAFYLYLRRTREKP